MKNVSFLIGSGFSVPAGYPTTTQLNERLCKIDASQISIHGRARFLDGETDPNAHIGMVEKKFVQEFLKFYCDVILGSSEKFNYESFIDYYRDLRATRAYPERLVGFFDDFRRKHRIETYGHQLLLDFHNTFYQLLTHLLDKPLERVYLLEPYPRACYSFLHLVAELSRTHRVHFHTLNHDLYMEHLANSDSMRSEMDDGFEELGSTFFGVHPDRYEEYKVRLLRFTGKFEKPFCLYKLHGSIDHFQFHDGDKLDLIKLKRQVSRWQIFKEVEEDGALQYVNNPIADFPDFLSGKTSKTEWYEFRTYYPTVFNHFKDNLHSSNTLIIIGYGFGDEKINEYIEHDFLTDDAKTLFVVGNRHRPPRAARFLARNRSFYLDGGVSGMDTESILKKMKP